MNFDLDIGQWIVIGLSAFLLVWYVLAGLANRNRGIATYRWLRAGLGVFGEISSAEWIGASNMGARLVVKKAIKPFRRVEGHYLLEPREFLPYWLISRLRGKRDEVLVRVILRTNPQGNLEIQRAAHRDAKNDRGAKQLHSDFHVVHLDIEDARLIAKVTAFLVEYGPTLEKITLRSEAPQLEIQARIKPLLRFSAESYFEAVQTWFQDS